MAFWAAAAPSLISAGGSLLGGIFGSRDRRKDQRRQFENQMRLLQEQTRLAQVGLNNPFRSVRWEGPLQNRRQVVTLNPADQAALDAHRRYRAEVMAGWNPAGGWRDEAGTARQLALTTAERKALEKPTRPEVSREDIRRLMAAAFGERRGRKRRRRS